MKSIAIFVENLFERRNLKHPNWKIEEFYYPYYTLSRKGYEVHLIGIIMGETYMAKSDFLEKGTHNPKKVKQVSPR